MISCRHDFNLCLFYNKFLATAKEAVEDDGIEAIAMVG